MSSRLVDESHFKSSEFRFLTWLYDFIERIRDHTGLRFEEIDNAINYHQMKNIWRQGIDPIEFADSDYEAFSTGKSKSIMTAQEFRASLDEARRERGFRGDED